MAERLRSTGRKSNRPPSFAERGVGGVHGTAKNTMPQASAALAAAAKNAAFQLAKRLIRWAQANESAPAIPMLAACAAVARDMSFPSTLSARSLRPVM